MPCVSVRGHDRALASLRSSAGSGRLPHAFLFVGPEGIGKRTFALTLAQALLCERNAEGLLEPCGECPGCVQVEAGSHPDLIVTGRPDDKQELPIRVIRDLCAEFGLKPARGVRKVAVVDDVDTMNDEAANAFLKTLEEPPPGAVLILIGTSAEQQLETIVSRCQVVRFDPLPVDELAGLLLEKGIAADADDAAKLAALAEGSVSRAIGLADPDLDRYRRDLIDGLAGERGFDPAEQVQQLLAFSKKAGKETGAQRRRASLMVGELARLFRGVLWQTAGLEPPSADPADRRAIAVLAQRLEPEDVFILADRALEADFHLARNLYMPLVLESLFHDVAKVVNPKARA
ncbi:MAG: DNA polymerase III subunit delta' [Paludisphaera borealis]|uniref:DNA polymerase III subunit delta' n=1 Tax=Paludisphaera borealis TaxID=1387353 RepID=UPI00284CE71A|nr:DNA polymerase III subunit delta' [Paludisphaera borealis]MDR3621481.1 DNA polymerase III subunit delta' [Paludisphaera borealis]